MRKSLIAALAATAWLAGADVAGAQGMSLAGQSNSPETTGSLGSRDPVDVPLDTPERFIALSAEQKDAIRNQVLTSRAPRLARAEFSLDVGTIVPRYVRARAVPKALVDVHPALRGYNYFVVGREIVIIEPGTSIIVAVIEV